MGFGDAIRSALSNYATFAGRASRPAFWWFALFVVLVQFAASFVDYALFATEGRFGVVGPLASLALLLPYLAVGARRLHDTDRSGWWLLLAFVPIVGTIALIVLCALPGAPGPNRYGPPPVEKLAV